MKNLIMLIFFLISNQFKSFSQELILENNLPEPVQRSIHESFPGVEIKSVTTTDMWGDSVNFRVIVDYQKEPRLNKLFYGQDGTLEFKIYVYKYNPEDLPLELIMNMQQKCGENNISHINMFDYLNDKEYRLMIGDSVFCFDSSYKFLKTIKRVETKR